jgi:hypothetical protein
VVPDSVEMLNPDGPFSLATKLTSIDLRATKIREVPEFCFSTASALEEILLPDSVKKIGHRAFADTKITEMRLPKSLSEIGLGVFFGCRKLRSVQVPEGNEYFVVEDRVLYDANKTLVHLVPSADPYQRIVFPKTIKQLMDFSVQFVTADEIVLPEGLEIIDKWSLQATNVPYLWVPDSVKSISVYGLWQTNVGWLSLTENVHFEAHALANAMFTTLHYRGSTIDPLRGLCYELDRLDPGVVVTVPVNSTLEEVCEKPVVRVEDEDLPYRPGVPRQTDEQQEL